MNRAFGTKNYLVIIGLALGATLTLGCEQSQAAGPDATPAAPATSAKAAKVVEVTVGNDGFQPNRIDVAQGQKVTLRFTRKSDATCATKVVFPDLSIDKELPLNQPVEIELPTEKADELAFQCGMGMYKSKVVVARN